MSRKKNNFVLTADLKKQHDLLQKRCDDFDTGTQDEVLGIANCLNVLLNDTQKIDALYFQLGYQKYPFLSRVTQYLPEDLNSYSGLVEIIMSDGERVKYIPQNEKTTLEKTIMFDDWWHEVVIDDLEHLYSRKDLVLYLSNKWDENCENPNKLDDSSVLTTVNWLLDNSKEQMEYNKIIYPTVRAIAQEVLDSFEVYHKHIHNTTTHQQKYAYNWNFNVYNIREKRLYIITNDESTAEDYLDTVFTNVTRLEGGYFASRTYYEVFITRGNQVTGSYFLLNK
jgi:hypothetical protein